MSHVVAIGSARLINETGLHARPSVKLTQLAKSFPGQVEMATSSDGPWINAKSPVKVMGFQAETGVSLYFRATGDGASDAVAALVALVERNFDEDKLCQTDGHRHG
ncbi:HPr family phosphocarrier protein [Burkholderia sp. Ac-20353]|uniref:HPr family phosphocarrier protein n=1 Tax=Burkholderia sp. Ac-20353 TaxID=2703894 RepID=UPI00197BF5D5|nr:HPr family phosphocarrier protein [Burkholderia sp. Ac-20353]MBN3786847.1 HPr family phosphocarrier protein [Burkholderia sp. Ac-20353]